MQPVQAVAGALSSTLARLASTAKEIRFGNEARSSILKGVETLSNAVATTLGPKGRTVLIDDEFEPRITKDGVSVARAIDFRDRYMNVGANLVKNVAIKTNEEAGDGTTTATVLAHSIFKEGCKSVAAGMNPADLKRGIDMAVDAVVSDLKRKAKQISSREELKQVATISANGDTHIGEFIASAMERVGKEGIVTVEEGRALKDELVVVDGIKFDQGFLSPFFVTDTHAMKAEHEEPLILLCNRRLTRVQDVAGPMNHALGKAQRPLIIVAEDIEGDALAVLIYNRIKNGAKVVAVKAPGYGESRRAWLHDLAVLTGGQVVSEEAGTNLEVPEAALFGSAHKVIVTKDTTIVQGGAGAQDALRAHCDGLKEQLKSADLSEFDRDRLRQRVAKLQGGVAVLKVGGASEVEVSEKKDRVTDALNATRAAVEEGVLPGGGAALLHASKVLPALKDRLQNYEQRVGLQIIADSLKQPTRRIVDNAGTEGVVVVGRLLEEKDHNVGYDAANGRYVNMVEAGIVDPLKVVRTALVDAASVASVMTTSEAVIVEAPKDKDDKPATPAPEGKRPF